VIRCARQPDPVRLTVSDHPAVLVVIPTYNERDNLPLIAEAVLSRGNYRLLVVDDGSPDGTGALADALAGTSGGRLEVLHRTGQRGLGRSYVEGFGQAISRPVDVVCQMDADFSHDPDELPRLVDAARDHDLVIGSRYVPGGRVVNWPLHRVVLSTLANRYIQAALRLAVRDSTAGFRCWRRDALARMPLSHIESDGYAFQIEMAWEAARRGFRIAEVPISFVERRRGQSKMSWAIVFEALGLPWRLRRRAA
jgi:dolichol-phosphate mannosyltransferase